MGTQGPRLRAVGSDSNQIAGPSAHSSGGARSLPGPWDLMLPGSQQLLRNRLSDFLCGARTALRNSEGCDHEQVLALLRHDQEVQCQE